MLNITITYDMLERNAAKMTMKKWDGKAMICFETDANDSKARWSLNLAQTSCELDDLTDLMDAYFEAKTDSAR